MPSPKVSSSFQSEVETMIRALESPRGIVVTLASPQAAHALRLRMYSARRTMQREAKSLYEPEDPRHGRSDFDELMFKIEGAKLLILPGSKITYEVQEL